MLVQKQNRYSRYVTRQIVVTLTRQEEVARQVEVTRQEEVARQVKILTS